VARAASSCNAFATATFSSLNLSTSGSQWEYPRRKRAAGNVCIPTANINIHDVYDGQDIADVNLT